MPPSHQTMSLLNRFCTFPDRFAEHTGVKCSICCMCARHCLGHYQLLDGLVRFIPGIAHQARPAILTNNAA